MRRREMGRETRGKTARQAIATVVFYTSFTLLTSCAPAFLPSYQNQQYPNLNEQTLVLKKKTESEFLDMLKKKGATNIICSKGYLNGHVISAVTADFMDYVYLFKNSTYLEKLKIKHDEGKPQVHPFVKIVYGKETFGIFLVADNIEYKGKRTAQLILVEKEGKLTYKSIVLEEMIKKHGGIYDPYIGGENLSTGVFLAGRMNTGEPWLSVYKIRLKGEELLIEKVPGAEAAGCSCYYDWVTGKDAREVFGMKVE